MNKIIHRGLISIISILMLTTLFFPSLGFTREKQNIDLSIEKHIDVTGGGIADDLLLRIKGESWNKPLKWTLTISSKGKKIFEHESDDTWLDKFFKDKGYVNDSCTSYLECKRQYYLHDLLDELVVKTDLSPNIRDFDKSSQGSIYVVAKKELLEKFHLSESDATKTINWMIEKLETKEVPILYVPISPVQSEFPRMFVDRVGKFVTIYEW